MNKEVIEALVTPFPAEAIRSRRGAHGEELHYIETWRVIDRLNQAFGHDWAFEILEHRVLEAEVVILGRLTAADISKSAFGGSSITRNRETGEALSIADDLKSSASDALKKCASLFGVALHLYAEAGATPEETRQELPQENPAREGWHPHRLTERQRSAILAISSQKGIDEDELDGWIRKSFGVPLYELSRRQASELITKLNSGNGGNGRAAQEG